MVQGNLKLKVKKPARVTKKQQNPKPAAPKIYTAKKGTVKTTSRLNKIHSGHLLTSTEKLIAGRVGHLELLKGSRRANEKAAKEAANKKAK